MAILLKNSAGKWIEPEEVGFAKEAELQSLLENAPELVERLGEGSLVFTAETSLTGSGYADLIGVSSSGEILVVETKLASNPDIRRTVIGQILEYAAFLWESEYSTIDAFFRRNDGANLLERLRARQPDINETEFRQTVQGNLDSGKFTLLIAVDGITEELRRVLQYASSVAAGMRLEALEVRKHQDGSVELLELQRYGIPSKKETVSLPKYTVEEILEKSPDEATRKKIEFLTTFWKDLGGHLRPNKESISCSVGLPKKVVTMFWVSPIERYQLQLNFQSMQQFGMPAEDLVQLRSEIGAIPGFPKESIAVGLQPITKYSGVDPEGLKKFCTLMSNAADKWRVSLRSTTE